MIRMSATFLILSAITLIGACAAMMLRGLVHCALAVAIAFAGLGTLYLNLGAQFLGLAQLLVYVGAIAVLIVFVILLTRGGESDATPIEKSPKIMPVDPAAWGPKRQKATKLRLAAFNISSMPTSTRMVLLRVSAPARPTANSMEETSKHPAKGVMACPVSPSSQ